MRWIVMKRYVWITSIEVDLIPDNKTKCTPYEVRQTQSIANPCFKFSVEIMVAIAALKSTIAWIWTWVINDFIAACGVITVFMTVAAINVAICYLLCIPFYYRGKSMRVWLHRRNPAKSWLP